MLAHDKTKFRAESPGKSALLYAQRAFKTPRVGLPASTRPSSSTGSPPMIDDP